MSVHDHRSNNAPSAKSDYASPTPTHARCAVTWFANSVYPFTKCSTRSARRLIAAHRQCERSPREGCLKREPEQAIGRSSIRPPVPPMGGKRSRTQQPIWGVATIPRLPVTLKVGTKPRLHLKPANYSVVLYSAPLDAATGAAFGCAVQYVRHRRYLGESTVLSDIINFAKGELPSNSPRPNIVRDDICDQRVKRKAQSIRLGEG